MLDTSNASMFPHRPSLGVHDFHLPRIDVNSLRGFITKNFDANGRQPNPLP
jgi:hypothetical protein